MLRVVLWDGLSDVQVPVTLRVHEQLPVGRVHVVCGVHTIYGRADIRHLHLAVLPRSEREELRRTVLRPSSSAIDSGALLVPVRVQAQEPIHGSFVTR